MDNKSFTIIEFVVVTTIIALLTGLSLANYNSGSKQLALQRASYKVAQDLRRVQEMSMSSRKFNNSVPQGGYGVFFWKVELAGYDFPHLYMLFADSDANGEIDFETEIVETVNLEEHIKFSDFYLDEAKGNGTYFTFIPPDPETRIVKGIYDSTRIILSLEDDITENKTILLNSAGLINVE